MIKIALEGLAIGIQLLSSLVSLVVGGLILKLTVKIFKIEADWVTVFKIAGINAAVGFVLGVIILLVPGVPLAGLLPFVVSAVLVVYLIKHFLKQEWGKSILVWLVWFILTIVIVFLVMLVVGFLAALIGLSVLAGMGGLGGL